MKTAAIMLCLAIGLAASVQAADSIGYFDTIKNDPDIRAGRTYYLRHNLMYEKGEWDATNYWRGVLLPINTKVTVEYASNKAMRISWESGSLLIENSKYTKCDMATLAKRMLAPNPVPVEKFGGEMAGSIASGTLVKGMTREQVIMTRGYPPAHKTPSITGETGRWIYWTSRYATETLVFKNGKLEKGRNMVQ